MIENRKKLLIAGFLTLIAAGLGFGVRTGLLAVWSKTYGFTFTELGAITGGGLLGFGLIILIAGFLIDALGYKKLLIIALFCHVVSAVMLFFATPIFNSAGRDATYYILYCSMFIFAVGNGICEAVINPLVATLYPKEKTHYLNILHAGWPGGLVLGGLVALLAGSIQWELLMATFLIPSLLYGYITLTEQFPETEAQKGTISYGDMFVNCVTPFFIFLLLVQAMVGYVELGTDSWISKITGSILANAKYGGMLFIYTSMLMFVLRFFAGPIVHRISSLGLLLLSACLGALGLYLISNAQGLGYMLLAVTVYALGKTFLWPTMLGVVGEQYPRSATVAMALLGFAGMTSAGALGGPGIGYKQDRYASEKLQEISEPTFQRYQADEENGFLIFKPIRGLDGQKVGVVLDKSEAGQRGVALARDKEIAQQAEVWETDTFKQKRELDDWWQANQQFAAEDAEHVDTAGLHGSRMAIRLTALIPATMAVCYLLMILGFRAKGGYRHAEEGEPEATPQ
ncbi:MFS transporter [Adhaeretor mobilis]|uniref:L-fucose transporter n=1 Tax=Adhaeretor mobilis TaxID=1930276 RepID=A0A517MVN9_9BACT|nr:MFS transporter [Adhaeretor mobilis]QDS98939.1 L-fucose transporter [Adhaeretor mobilis]